MKEIKNIIKAFDEAQVNGKQTALATVVHVDGSSYRRPGARMLVTVDGELTGAISGGCLEGDALRKALYVMTEGRTMLVTYDTSDEDDAKLGLGLGCNGIIQVLIEPIDPAKIDNPIALLKATIAKRQQAVLVTLFSLDKKQAQPGTCLLVTEDENIRGIKTGIHHLLMDEAKLVLNTRQSSFRNYTSENQNLTAFIEWITPTVSLVIGGAGNDVIPLVEMAEILGWEVTLVDGRPAYAKKERFSPSCQVVLARPEEVLANINIDEQTVFVLISHNYNYDLALLRQLIKHNISYVGLLGPRKKFERMLNELEDEGIRLTEAQLSVIYSPVGLDIGAETPDEIALSIVSEIKAVLSLKEGSSLKHKDVIHERSHTRISEIKLDPK